MCGAALAYGPTLWIQFADDYLNTVHQAEADRWAQRHSLPGVILHATSAMITPGRDGYLLLIPRIGVRAIVHELEPAVLSGLNTPALKRYGVGQIPFTPQLRNVAPGGEGTAAITGHRTTSGAPFRHLDRLRPGDLVIIRKGNQEQRWLVVSAIIAAPDQVAVLRSAPGLPRLALLACDPPFSARARLVVYASMPAGEQDQLVKSSTTMIPRAPPSSTPTPTR